MSYERHVGYAFLRQGELVELEAFGEFGGTSVIAWFEKDWQGLWIWRVAWDVPRWRQTGSRTLLQAVRAAGLWDALKVIRARCRVHLRLAFVAPQ